MELMIPIPEFKTWNYTGPIPEMLGGNLACFDAAWLKTLRLFALHRHFSTIKSRCSFICMVTNGAFEALRHSEDPTFLSPVVLFFFGAGRFEVSEL
jgi:hypothetical protein